MAESITWAVLLARWTEFAKSAVALPTSGSGGRWRESVASIIGLQAIALALRDLDEHDLGDGRALAIDTASVGLDSHARDLAEVWADEPWPEELHELIEDARLALQGARAAGREWCVDAGPARLEHPAAEVSIQKGDAGDSMFVVAAGQLEVVHPGQREAAITLSRGAIVGEMSLLTGEPRSATVQTLTTAVLYEIRKDALDSVLAKRPSLAAELGSLLSHRMCGSQEQAAYFKELISQNL